MDTDLFEELSKKDSFTKDRVNQFLISFNSSISEDWMYALQQICSSLSNKSDDDLDDLCQPVPADNRDLRFTDVKMSETATIILVLLFSLEMVISIFGNSLVLLIFSCRRQMRSITNFFIVSLAASDLLMTVSCIPFNTVQVLTGFLQMGSMVCKMGPFIMQLTVAASSLTLCCIAFDRYIAVVHPLHMSTIQSPQRAALLMAVVWVVAIGSSMPFAYYYQLHSLCVPGIENEDCASYCGIPSSLHWLHWMTYILLLLVPMVLMSVMYAIIIFKLWFRKQVGTTVVNAESFRMQYKKKAIKMLFVVMVTFVSCWMPLLTFDLLATLLHLPLDKSMVTLRYCLQCLALSATCYNPIIYTLMHDKFRKHFSGVFTCCKHLPVRISPASFKLAAPKPQPRLPVIENVNCHFQKQIANSSESRGALAGTSQTEV